MFAGVFSGVPLLSVRFSHLLPPPVTTVYYLSWFCGVTGLRRVVCTWGLSCSYSHMWAVVLTGIAQRKLLLPSSPQLPVDSCPKEMETWINSLNNCRQRSHTPRLQSSQASICSTFFSSVM